MIKKLTLFALLFAIALLPYNLFSADYQVKRVVNYPLFPTYPIKINNNGMIVGANYDKNIEFGTFEEKVFIYDSKNEKELPINFCDNLITRICDINNKNEIVGIYSANNFSPTTGRNSLYIPFTYSTEKGFSSLKSTYPEIDGFNTYGAHLEINDSGMIAGFGFINSQKKFSIKSLNNNGDIAGAYFHGTNQDSRLYKPSFAFMQDHTNQKIIPLGNLGKDKKFFSSATCINYSKQIVGMSEVNVSRDNNKYRCHAFLWENGSMSDLGTYGQDLDSVAYSINNQGAVVGVSGTRDVYDQLEWVCGFRRAFLWTKQNGMQDLNRLIDKTEYILLEAVSINDHGQIVCLAHDLNLNLHLLRLDAK